MEFISVTLEVSKLDKSKLVRLPQLSNMPLIFVTLDVSKLDKSSSVKLLEQHQWTEEADMIVYDITKITREQEARDWLLRFLEEANRNTSGQNHRSNLVRNVLEYIRGHITDGLVLEEVAKKFYVSPNYLSCIIHKETGKTYRQHVIEAKMTVAKQMLNDTRMRVEDVAYAVGYENYISFYNVFKRIEHMSPSEYRFQKWNGEQL